MTAPAMVRAPVLLVADDPARYGALRHSALSGRVIHLWLVDGAPAPDWAVALRGAPGEPATYDVLRGTGAIAVLDVADERLAREVARAFLHTNPGGAVLGIERRLGRRHHRTTGSISWIDEGELLADAIENVLRRVATRRRVDGLRRALAGERQCAFLVQHDPDPDAIASALALRTTLGYTEESAPLVTRGQITRPENRRLIAELGIAVRHVSARQLAELAPLVLVDVQPPYFGIALTGVAAVVDHHPSVESYAASFRDVRTSYGASATMAAEYLLADGDALLTRRLATALLYGIITDTKSLTRGASEEDLQMFARLFPRADHSLLRRIQHPSYSPLALRRLGQELQRARVSGGLAYLHLGVLPESEEHVVAQLAEFCLGMAGATVAVVSGVFGGRLVMSGRALSAGARLGVALREAFGKYGSAGGHPMMAKAVVPLDSWRTRRSFTGQRGLERSVRRALRAALARAGPPGPRVRRARRTSAPARA